MPRRLGSRIWLARSHPNFLISFAATTVGVLGTGILSVTADPSTPTPPVLRYYYGLLGIGTWGLMFLAAGLLMAAGLFRPTFTTARLGLALTTALLAARLVLQVQAAVMSAIADGWSATASMVAGLPLLVAILGCCLAQTLEPPQNPLTGRR